MSKALYVYSTLAADVAYTRYAKGGADMPIVEEQILIKGGAGVANDRFVTPLGVATRVTQEQADFLNQDFVFSIHKKNGFVQISETEVDGDKAAADMTGRDHSAPVVAHDLPADLQPSVGDGSKDEDDEPAPTTRKKRGQR